MSRESLVALLRSLQWGSRHGHKHGLTERQRLEFAFHATGLGELLRSRGVTHLLLAGVTTEVCVQTTMREANDRGYECLLLADCCGATDHGNHLAAIKMVKMQGGVFGAVADSKKVVEALKA